MKKQLPITWRSLTVQLVTSFVVLVMLTAVAVGLPAIWLIQSQSENQAWAQVEQGSRATQALLTAQQKEVEGLALLTAQRPSLPDLLAQKNSTELVTFLDTLQEGTELNILVVCDPRQQQIAMSGGESIGDLCGLDSIGGLYVAPPEVTNRLWLLASEQIEGQPDSPGRVIVGITLDDQFAAQMKNKTGLEHIFSTRDKLLASSFSETNARSAFHLMIQSEPNPLSRATFTLQGRPYYAASLDLGQAEFVDEVALEVTHITLTQQRLVSTLIGSMILAAVVGSVVGVLLARGLGLPLHQLAEAAATMRSQDLETAVIVSNRVQEVTMVAQALETTRIELQRTLNQLRQTNAWNDHLLASISEGIVVLDENGRVTFFSPGAERIIGSPSTEVLGQMAGDVFHLAGSDEQLSHLLPPPGQTYKIQLELAEDRQATLAMTSANLSLPTIGKAGTALVFRDISDTERIHHLLGQFLANITHEFRTPLSAIAASTELLMDQAADLTPSELQELLNSLYLGILGLQTLIDNLLESASQEAGRFKVYPRITDLGSIIIESINTMKPLQEKYGHRVSLDLSPTIPLVQADPRRITQVMINLLSNAIKYSPDDSEIVVHAFEEDSFMRVAIADQGPGVPPGYRPNLFRRLVRPGAESSKAQYGVGLGLSVVKAIVEAHGGQVGVADGAEGGSIFWFTLPKGFET